MMPDYTYVGPARLSVLTGDRTTQFRGRVPQHPAAGALRFYVNLLPSGRLPEGWPRPEGWVEVADEAALEWTGKKANK